MKDKLVLSTCSNCGRHVYCKCYESMNKYVCEFCILCFDKRTEIWDLNRGVLKSITIEEVRI